MPVLDYFVNNLVMLFELVGLFIILFISAHVSKQVKLYTRITILLLFISMLVTATENWLGSRDTYTVWRPILTSFKYTFYPLILLSVILMVSQFMAPIPLKWFLPALIPVVVALPIYLSSQWTGLVFKYATDTNSWGGGPLRLLPYIIFVFYLVIFLAQNIVYLRYYSTRNRIIALYIALGYLAIVVTYFIIEKTEDFNPLFTTSVLFYFLFIYIHLASIDPLTGLKNRQSYYQDMDEFKHKITFISSIDMNDLKLINDNEGHAAGDEAIKTIAKILKNNVGLRANCYRVGGDEFMIFFFYNSENEVKKRIASMREEIEKANYSCAFGYAKRNPKLTMEENIQISDQKMYENKAEMKVAKKKDKK